VQNQQALALPESAARVAALPARPLVRVLDLLRAIDGAAVVGDLFAVRALTAAAVRQLEPGALADGAGGVPEAEGGVS
jgi:hypothetical protein